MIRAVWVNRCPGVKDTYFRLGKSYFRVLPKEPTREIVRDSVFDWVVVVEHSLFVDRDEAARRLVALGYSPLDAG